ncbi:WbuC family cupin fold metalloprotein [Buttiauxella ferragutiae]|uniref:WbuC family cupin fold metalloprotein n=1 Tax=Buttiauxella ferragutiae TaxID=82989 RepID=UPI001F52E62E|nr:WbuC family cupin fold metalloprotein [Buttiauxella ferragutiae]UNK62859.1 WbuC family cupin fold metalloprotein [Buttiauxella ferragutiae]
MKLIDKNTFNCLYEEALSSERKRAHYLLHKSHADKVQRLLIAMVQNSFVEPHYHELATQWEMFLVIEGCIKVCLYDLDGNVIDSFVAGPEMDQSIVEFLPGDIHSVECITSKAMMLEVKEGPFHPETAKVSLSTS